MFALYKSFGSGLPSTGLTGIFPAWTGRTLSWLRTGRVRSGSFSTPVSACGLTKPRTATCCMTGRNITRGSQKRWLVPRKLRKLLRHVGGKQTISTSNAQRMLKRCPSMIRAMPLFLLLLQKKKTRACLTRARALNARRKIQSRKQSLLGSRPWRLTSSSSLSRHGTGVDGMKPNTNG